MAKSCRILSPTDKEIAKKLGMSESVYTIVLSAYASSVNNPDVQPTEEEITKFHQSQIAIAKAEKALIGQENIAPKTSIPQNRVSGKNQYGFTQTARKEIIDKLGENTTSIDMVEAGYRTRTTRSVTEAQKYNLSVGDIFEQYGVSKDGTTKRILTRVTAIYGKEDPRFLGNWNKEGWTNEGIEDIKRLKDGAQAIEFEVINQAKGENISSKGSEFAKRLTNPFNKETVEFRGTKFDNAEHAYQTWKSGKFDQKGYDAHGGKVNGTTDYNTNYQTMVEIITAKLQQHPDLVQGIAERGGEAYLKASTHDVIGDKYWETKTGQNKFIEALTEAYNRIKSMPTTDKLTQEQVLTRLNEYQAWTKDHVTFKKADHTYYVDDKKVDYSVTQFEGTEFEAKHIDGDYTFTQEIGKAVDALTRDFFKSDVDINKKNYSNLNEKRKQEIVDSLIRLKAYFDNRFGEGYTVVTEEFPLAGIVKSDKAGGEVTMAGTMDLIVIDRDGFVHIFDMKAKNRTTFEYKNKSFKSTDERDYTFQLNTYQQLLEGIIPGLKVASKQLIWFNQEYPKQFVEGRGGDAKYVTDEKTGEVTVTDLRTKQTQPLADYSEWKTPQLKTKGDTLDDESEEASIKKIKDSKSSISEVIPIDPKWSPTEIYNKNTQEQMEENPNFNNITAKVSVESSITEKGENPPVIPDSEMQVNKSNPKADYLRQLNSTQRMYRGEYVAKEFSNIISIELNNAIEKAVQDKDLALLNILNDPDKGRKHIIGELSPSEIFERVRKSVEKELEVITKKGETAKQQYISEQLRLMLAYWNFIVEDSFAAIESAESIRLLSYNSIKNDNDTVTGGDMTSTDDDNDNEESDTDDDETGQRNVNGNEGWGYKYREVDPTTTLSKMVKAILGTILARDANGNVSIDDIGHNRYLDQEYAHVVLISELSSCKTPDDFCHKVDREDYESEEDYEDAYDFIDDKGQAWQLTALREVAKKYPWVEDIITSIVDEGNEDGKEHKPMQLVSMFYSDFRKDFIPYWKQFKDADGKWKTLRLNQRTSTQSALNQVINNYEQGRKVDKDSVYGNTGKEGISKENAEKGVLSDIVLNTFNNLRNKVTVSDEEYIEATKALAKALRMIGFEVNNHTISNALKLENGTQGIYECCDYVNNILNGVIKDNNPSHLINTYKDTFQKIAERIGLVTELENMQSFRSGDKTFYSYSAPNYLDDLFNNLFSRPVTEEEEAKKMDFLEREFGKYDWFKQDDEWRSLWLEEIANGNYIDKAELKELNTIADRSADDEVKNTYYTEWSPLQIKTAFIREFFSVPLTGDRNEIPMAYYNFPIFANSPVAKFVKFRRYILSDNSDYRTLVRGFRNVVKQEIDRITLVLRRNKEGAREIGNFDKAGSKFCFFPELNRVDEGEFYKNCMKLIGNKLDDKLDDYINRKIEQILTKGFNEFLKKNIEEGELISYLRDAGILGENSTHEDFIETMKDYYWNQAFASTQIIQLCTTDIAYYKNGTDFQKRFKELYAAGIKLNTNSKWGKQFEKTAYLKDSIITSFNYNDIKDVLSRAEKEGRINKYDKAIILAAFKDVNIADAQAYRSIKSMRSVLDMLGKWNDSMQAAMDRFEAGEWTMADFNVVWQTIKPFVYTQIEKPNGLSGENAGIIKVPHQNKNSEFLILALYNIVRSPINKSPMMRGLDKFMQDNDIDVIQFESAVKAGNQGRIDLTHSKDKLEKWFDVYSDTNNGIVKVDSKEMSVAEAVSAVSKSDKQDYNTFKKGLDILLDKGSITQKEYNAFINMVQLDEGDVIEVLNKMTKEVDANGKELKVDGKPVFKKEVVHSIPYKDYCIQQPTPEHLIDHEAVFGSQFRNLIISDIPDDFEVTIRGKKYNKKSIKDLYQSIIVANLIKDYQKVKGKFATIEDLQAALLQTVKGNTRYSRDMEQALQIVELSNGEKVFNIPLDNPSTTDKIQELTNSMFKSAIQKQKIKGGTCIMVSSFGLMDDLHIRFNKDGDEASGIKGIECYLPASSRQHYEPFMKTDSYIDENGKEHEYQYIDVEELKKAGLDKLIGYRIPTEDKYSMANLIVKGFLPQQNGSAIMLPAEITRIAGSDFDVDKMFLMIPEFKVYEYDYKKAREDYAKMNSMFNSIFSKFKSTELIEEITSEEPDDFKLWFEENKEAYKYDKPIVRKVRYNDNKSPLENSREQRNNMLIDISYAILSHPDTATKVLNPGSFDKMKVAARIATISNDEYLAKKFWVSQKFKGNELAPTNVENDYDADELADILLKISEEQDLDTLDDFLKKEKLELDPLSVDTFIYYHVQNMTGDALIGMYALNTTMQGKYQNTKLALKKEHYFKINGRVIDDLNRTFTKGKKEGNKRSEGERISKICANGSAASVDNVKDPVLADLMQNMNTANICGFMMRAGMTLEEIGLFFSQPLVRKAVQKDGSLDNLESYLEPLQEALDKLQGSYSKNVLMRDFSSKELLMNILVNQAVEEGLERIDKGVVRNGYLLEVEVDSKGRKTEKATKLDTTKLKKVLAQQIEAIELMIHMRNCAEDLSMATRISRADSPNGAINRNIAGARNQIQAVTNYKLESVKPTFHLTNTEGVPINDYFDVDKMSEQEMLDAFMRAPMPMLQAFYSLGIDFGLKAMKKYYVYNTDIVEDYTKYLYNNTKRGTLTDEQLRLFYQELVEFALTTSSLIGDNFDEKRDYYLYDYPEEFIKVIRNNPDIANLKALRKLLVQNGEIVFENAGRTTPKMREAMMRDFDSLLYMDNPNAQKLAEDLFMYAFYRNGFKFGPRNYGMYFSSTFISSFPNFVHTLRTMNDIVYRPGFMQNFIRQFYVNHASKGYLPYIKKPKEGEDYLYVDVDENGNIKSLAIKSGYVFNSKAKENPDNVSNNSSYPFIVYSGEVYELNIDSKPYAYYTPMPKLSNEQKGKRKAKFNANMSIEQIAAIQVDPKRLKKEEAKKEDPWGSVKMSLQNNDGDTENSGDIWNKANYIEGEGLTETNEPQKTFTLEDIQPEKTDVCEPSQVNNDAWSRMGSESEINPYF